MLHWALLGIMVVCGIMVGVIITRILIDYIKGNFKGW
jgi:uncharacterized membrane-anchored protein YhcB (DUF1043 family)